MYKRHLSATVLECATVAGVSHQHGPHRGRLPWSECWMTLCCSPAWPRSSRGLWSRPRPCSF